MTDYIPVFFQKIRPIPKSMLLLCCGVQLATHPTPKLEYYPFLAVRHMSGNAGQEISKVFTLERAMKAQMGSRFIALSLASALDTDGGLTPLNGCFIPGNEPVPTVHGRSGRLRKISTPTGIPFPDLPARSKSLYRLSHPGPLSRN